MFNGVVNLSNDVANLLNDVVNLLSDVASVLNGNGLQLHLFIVGTYFGHIIEIEKK
jgi:hypothetical protein